MPDRQRKLAAIMFTDIVGYTALMGRDEEKALQLLHENRDLIKPLIQSHRGEWLKEMGDGTLSSFASAVEAVNCALEIQQSLKDDPDLSLRIGIHIGDVVFEEGDVFGDGVNVASRLEPLAAPGGICVSGRVYDDIRNKPDIKTVYLGEQSLKNVDHPVKVYALSGEGLPVPKGLIGATATVHRNTVGRNYGIAGGFLVGTIIAVIAYVAFFGGPAQADIRIPTAVVDFINETGEPELDGLSGMLITSLEQSRRLSVVTRARMFDILKKLGTTDVDRIDEALGRKIAQEANLQALVVASMRKFGSQYTINLQVMDPQQGEYLFTASRTGEGQESIPGLLDQLSRDIRAGLKEKRAQIESNYTPVANVTTVNLEAYQHYFKGEELVNRLKFEAAAEEFEKAIAIDSSFGLAYYRSAYATSRMFAFSPAAARIAKAHLQQALALIDRIPERERYLLRAQQAQSDEGYEAGIVILKEMERIYPNDKEMIFNIGDLSYHWGDYPAAAEYLERALTIDPSSERTLQRLAWTYRDVGEYKKSMEAALRYVEVAGSAESYLQLGDIYVAAGDFDSGLKNLHRARELSPGFGLATTEIADVYMYQERYDQAEAEAKTLIADQPAETKGLYYPWLWLSYLYLGKYQEAIRALDIAMELNWQAGFTSAAVLNGLQKGLLMVWAGQDVKSAWEEAEKTVHFQGRLFGGSLLGGFYWSNYSYLAVLNGDAKLAETSSVRGGGKYSQPWVRALIHSAQHQCAQAEPYAEAVFQNSKGWERIALLYPLAQCQFEAGQLDKAAESLLQLQAVYDNAWSFRGAYYPKSFYLLGKIYEKKGDTKLATEHYEKFLELWKNADEDLPELLNARARHARLIAMRASS